MDGKWWKVLILLVLGFSSYGQYVYTYTDPCTGILNSVTITQPSGSVTLFYAGQFNTFTQAQLQAGAFELWVQSVNATAPPGSNPCAGAGGTISTGSNASTGTNTATNVSGIVGVAANIGGSIGSNAGSGASTGASTGGGDAGGAGDAGGGDEGETGEGGESSGSSSGSGGGGGGAKVTGGGSGGSSSGGGGGGSGQPSGGASGTSSGGGTSSSSGTGGTTDGGGTDAGSAGGGESTTTASGGDSESSSSEGGVGGGKAKPKSKQEKVGRGALIGAGDFVIVRNSSDIKQSGMDNFRFNMSITHVNTKQTFIKGVNLNYTTGENVANVTAYGSYKKDGFMGVFSNSTMTNFKTDIFNTTTILVAQKVWIVTPMLGTNFTLGKIGESDFQNWSVVAGGYTNFKGIQALSGNVMLLGIYSPYIFYYEGQWYKSGILLVPLANIDFKITSTFKWSLSFGGAYQYKADVLNYQLSTGTKIML